MIKKLIYFLLFISIIMFIVYNVDAQTSRFEKTFRTTSGTLLIGATIYIVNQSTSTQYNLTEDATKDGVYYNNAVPYGHYKIYVNGALRQQNYYFGTIRQKNFIDAVDPDGDNKISGTNAVNGLAIEDSTITGAKLTTALYNLLTADTIINNPDDESIINVAPTNLGVNSDWLDTTKMPIDTSKLKSLTGSADGARVFLYFGLMSGWLMQIDSDLLFNTTGDSTRNNATIYENAASNTKWVRLEFWEKKILRPEWFGAKNNGTEAMATRKAIESACDSIWGAKYPVILSDGTYMVDTTIQIRHNGGAIIEGQGYGITIIKADTDFDTSSPLIDPYLAWQGTEFRSIGFDGNNRAKYGIITDNPRMVIWNCKFEKFEYGIAFEGTYSANASAIYSSEFYNCSAAGIYINDGSLAVININDCIIQNNKYGIWAKASVEGYWVRSCYFEHDSISIFNETAKGVVENCYIHNADSNASSGSPPEPDTCIWMGAGGRLSVGKIIWSTDNWANNPERSLDIRIWAETNAFNNYSLYEPITHQSQDKNMEALFQDDLVYSYIESSDTTEFVATVYECWGRGQLKELALIPRKNIIGDNTNYCTLYVTDQSDTLGEYTFTSGNNWYANVTYWLVTEDSTTYVASYEGYKIIVRKDTVKNGMELPPFTVKLRYRYGYE